jgi:putative DNA primase/helicase
MSDAALVVNPKGIPAELRDLDRWVCWRWGKVDPATGKRKKPPLCPADPARHASSTNEQTWSTFQEAVSVVEAGKADGIGMALGSPYVGVDLDEELPEADQGAIMLALDSYSERSVSGAGYHVVIRANLNGSGRHPQGIGVFQVDRLFYFSGEHVVGTPTTIESRQAELEQVLAAFLPAPEQGEARASPARPTVPVDVDDQELLGRALRADDGGKFKRLWNGDTSAYDGDDSRADQALCNKLAFWTGRDAGRIDSLFRASGLYRGKWERASYRKRTIEAAIAKTTDVYTPATKGASKSGTHLGTHPENPSSSYSGGVSLPGASSASLRKEDAPGTDALSSPPESNVGETCTFEFETAAEFAAVDEPSADMLLGYSDDDAAAVAGGTVVMFGAGGAGKTTLSLDVALHMAVGTGWQGLKVARPTRFLIVENDGPRGRFRRKVRAKLADWTGDPPGDRLIVLKTPWGLTSLARWDHREALAAYIREHKVDVLIAGPIVSLGMIGGGTPDEVSAFEAHLAELRALLERPLAVWLIHHQNVRGQISGAWDRVPDTLIRVVAIGHGHTRLVWQKARDSSTLHGTSWKLKWTPGSSFEIDETPDVTEEDIAAGILAAVLANPGASWNKVDPSVKGNATTKRQVRDRLFADGQLVNRGKGKKFELWAGYDPELPEGMEQTTLGEGLVAEGDE